MTSAEDVQFDNLPLESCGNCGFVSKFTADSSDGQNAQDHLPLTQFERWSGLDELNDAVWGGRRIAALMCWRRRGFLEQEAPVVSSTAPGARAKSVEVLRKDRSADSSSQCRQYTPWVPHLSFTEHWTRWQADRAEAGRRAWEAGQEQSRRRYESRFVNRWLPLVVAFAGIVVGAVIGLYSVSMQNNATIRAAELQREAQPTINVAPPTIAPPVINVIVPTATASATAIVPTPSR